LDNDNNKGRKPITSFTIACQCLWRLFSSVKLAIVLILILICLSLIGILFFSPDFFNSLFFITPGALLLLNILVCSINRWTGIKKILNGGQIKRPDSFFDSKEKKSEILDVSLPSVEVVEAIKHVLQKRHYRVRFENDENNVYLAADKNRYFKLGTFISHLSIILFILAYIIGNIFGFQNTEFVVTEGEIKEVGYDTNLSLNLISFVDEYSTDGIPTDYRSEVILYENNQVVTSTTIRVNRPLIYQGIRFYQSYFGPAAGIQITQNDENIFTGDVALSESFQSNGYYRYTGSIDLDRSGLSIYIIGSAFNAIDPMIPHGQLAVLAYKNGEEIGVYLLEKDTPLEIDDIELTHLYDSQYSGFQVSKDPGNALVWISCTLFIIGLVMVFYFPHTQIWVFVKSISSRQSKIYIRSLGSPAFFSETELKELISAVNNKQKNGVNK
jgi:cytochrome c biogenesis protein